MRLHHKYLVAVDFDGVIHDIPPDPPGGFDPAHFGPPVKGAIEWLKMLLQVHPVAIFSCRGDEPHKRNYMYQWLLDNGITDVELLGITITNIKPHAKVYLDDRGLRFDGSTFPTLQELQEIKTWQNQL